MGDFTQVVLLCHLQLHLMLSSRHFVSRNFSYSLNCRILHTVQGQLNSASTKEVTTRGASWCQDILLVIAFKCLGLADCNQTVKIYQTYKCFLIFLSATQNDKTAEHQFTNWTDDKKT